MARSGESTPPARDRYHHGNLRAALVEQALVVLAESGPGSLSVRDVARRAGVSHAAATYHFGDRRGLLTAVAIEGCQGLAAALEAARPSGFLEVGVAYVRFAREHPGHFAVMFDARELHEDDPALQAARAAAGAVLFEEVPTILPPRADPVLGGLAAWSLVHGLASLAAGGMVPAALDDDPDELARRVARVLGAGQAVRSR